MGKQQKTADTTVSSSETARKTRWKAKFTEYVNFTPTDAQKERFAGWISSHNLWDELAMQMDRGIRVSWEWDDYSNCYQASAFCKDMDNVNAGRVCTARANEQDTALSRLMWYISEDFPEDWKAKVKQVQKDIW